MIEVVRAGCLSSVQDLGRPGYRRFGVSPGGAADALALRLANRLVGNATHAAGIEVTAGPKAQFAFDTDTTIALAGADLTATLDAELIGPGWRLPVRAGQLLTFGAPRSGLRAYLAVAGGIDVPIVLGSCSTDLNARFGGYANRALKDGDRLHCHAASAPRDRFGIKLLPWTATIRALPGPEFETFTDAARAVFWKSDWQASPQSNRMGYRLTGPTLLRTGTDELRSHAVFPGTVQVPPNGQPIALLVDAQTTGGYRRIATVIEADLWKLGQLPLGNCLRFVSCTLDEARAARQALKQYLRRVEASLHAH